MRKQKIELFINSLDLSDVVASIIHEGENAFMVKLRRIGKSGRLAKQAGSYIDYRGGMIHWGEMPNKKNAPIAVPAALLGERQRIPVRPAPITWEFVSGVAPYNVGIDAARVGQDITVFARQFADATGRSAADIEDDIQNVINLETLRRIDQTLLEGGEGDGE